MRGLLAGALWLLEKGSVIEMEGSPGPHLLPMNEEAKAAFEDWYKEEHPVFDKDGEPIFYLDESGSRVQKFYASVRGLPSGR